MDRVEAHAYEERWRIANDRIAEEARNTPYERRWAQMVALHDPQFAAALSPTPPDVDDVRARWARLRREHNA